MWSCTCLAKISFCSCLKASKIDTWNSKDLWKKDSHNSQLFAFISSILNKEGFAVSAIYHMSYLKVENQPNEFGKARLKITEVAKVSNWLTYDTLVFGYLSFIYLFIILINTGAETVHTYCSNLTEFDSLIDCVYLSNYSMILYVILHCRFLFKR